MRALVFCQTTLSLAQTLYKAIRYSPTQETDSRCLPEDYVATVKETLTILTGESWVKVMTKRLLPLLTICPSDFGAKLGYAGFSINAKISDRFAIIPTPKPQNLSELDKNFTICR